MTRASRCPKNRGGKLVIRKPWPSMLRGIWGDPQRYKETYWSEVKGSYFTGDGCRQDKDGYFWIVGRIDDVLNVAGHRIGTAEVESALVSNQKVAEAAVVGRPDELKGQALVAFVTLKTGVTADPRVCAKNCAQHVAKEIGPVAKPDDIRFAEALAQNALRKNHAPFAQANRLRRRNQRRHHDAGRFQRAGEAGERVITA